MDWPVAKYIDPDGKVLNTCALTTGANNKSATCTHH
jgi:hypothetical protein